MYILLFYRFKTCTLSDSPSKKHTKISQTKTYRKTKQMTNTALHRGATIRWIGLPKDQLLSEKRRMEGSETRKPMRSQRG